MSLRMSVLAVATLLTVAGCAETSASPAPRPTVPTPSGSSPAAVRVVDEQQADLHLWVSNQSFADDPVTLTVTVDGTEVVAQPFEVEGQHSWILFGIKAPPGRHVLTVTSGTGAELEKRFTLAELRRRYGVIDYWNYPDDGGRHITWRIQSQPLAFD